MRIVIVALFESAANSYALSMASNKLSNGSVDPPCLFGIVDWS